MKPRLLLDVHLAKALARALARRGIDAIHVADWEDSDLYDADDDAILAVAAEAGRIVVTRDSSTFPDLAGRWNKAGRSHAGLIVVSPRIAERDIGGQTEAILAAIEGTGDLSWTDLVIYAHRQR